MNVWLRLAKFYTSKSHRDRNGQYDGECIEFHGVVDPCQSIAIVGKERERGEQIVSKCVFDDSQSELTYIVHGCAWYGEPAVKR